MDWMKTHRNDLVLIAVLLILGGALALFLNSTRENGAYVVIQVDGEVVARVWLGLDGQGDGQMTLGEGEHTNTLVIRNGTAQVIEATCPDQVCVRQGAIRYAGESIVCLPHKLIVTLEGGESNGVDATAK